jgi:hypothetical protein
MRELIFAPLSSATTEMHGIFGENPSECLIELANHISILYLFEDLVDF